MVMATVLLAGLTACNKPKAAGEANSAQTGMVGNEPAATSAKDNLLTHLPSRKPGLWIQTMSRNGKVALHVGEIRMCLDAAADAKLGMLGRGMSNTLCQESVSRGLDGSYVYDATCKMGASGSVHSKGTITGDFSSAYKVHTESDMTGMGSSGSMHNVMDIEAHYAGACPADMVPGDMMIGHSMKVNVNKMPAVGAAMGGG